MKTSLYSFNDYKILVNQWVIEQPSKGRGLYRQMALSLDVHPTFISQIFQGYKDLSSDQAFRLSEFMEMSEHESDFFMTLVEYNRASSHRLKERLEKKLQLLRIAGEELLSKMSHSLVLSSQDQAEFYSDWRYSALRHFLTLSKYQARAQLAKEKVQNLFGLTAEKYGEITRFLISRQLIIEEESGYRLGIRSTHLPSSSPHLPRHHANWRLLAMSHHLNPKHEDLFFTSALTLSEKDAALFRTQLTELLESLSKRVQDSPAEELYALNIDWFRPLTD
jgi:uncharacterized protein (TIGR02147 family)